MLKPTLGGTKYARHIAHKSSFCKICQLETLHVFKYELKKPKVLKLFEGSFKLSNISKRCTTCNTESVLDANEFEAEKKVYTKPRELK